MTSGKDESDLRDVLLVMLNGTFQGQATGETFVRSGRTDILVTVENRHVFVGECKWYDGPQSVSAALDQLLGYMPWRDQKGCLLLFIDRVDATSTVEGAAAACQAHSCFLRPGADSDEPEARRNFVFAHDDDSAQTIDLALLVCVLEAGHRQLARGRRASAKRS